MDVVDRVICRDSVDRAFLAVATSGWERDGWWPVPMLGRRAELPAVLRRDVLADEACAQAVPAEAAGEIDAEAVAEWITGLYRDSTYPAVVLGSPHGGAVHLAAALGAAWLPTTFPVSVRWPGGSVADWPAARDWGATVAGTIVAGNPGVSVRQVHDPVMRGPLCGRTVSLRLWWRTLPAAYTEFLRTRLQPGGSSLLLRDLRRWPVLPVGPRTGFQLGSPTAGWSASDYRDDRPPFRRLLDGLGAATWSPPPVDATIQYAETAGDPALDTELRALATSHHQVLYRAPELLSAGLADLFRSYLDGDTGCLVECGRLLDPRGVLSRRLVPYWCESASLHAFAGAECWLAGSAPFDEITVLPDAPGTDCEAHAALSHWRSLAAFAGTRGRVDRVAAGRYPLMPLSSRHAARVVGTWIEPRPAPPRLTMEHALDALRPKATPLGLIVD
jgi:hypothetical protein